MLDLLFKDWSEKLIIAFIIASIFTLFFALISKKYKWNFWSNEKKCRRKKKNQ